MNTFTDSVLTALNLVTSFDPALWVVVTRSLAVSATACLLAYGVGAALGVPLGVGAALGVPLRWANPRAPHVRRSTWCNAGGSWQGARISRAGG